MECYQELVNSDPRNAIARNGLGIALARLGRYEEAEGQFRSAIASRAGFPEAYFNLAGVLQSTGRFGESEMPLRRALKLKPVYLDARVSLGMSLVLLNRLEEARDCYEKALRSEASIAMTSAILRERFAAISALTSSTGSAPPPTTRRDVRGSSTTW